MLGRQAHAGAGHGEHGDGQGGCAAEHVAHLGELVGHLVHALPEEVHEHEVDDGTAAGCGCANAQADDAFFRDGRIEHPVRAELAAERL